jgi:type IV secretory pathway VirB10-like protein
VSIKLAASAEGRHGGAPVAAVALFGAVGLLAGGVLLWALLGAKEAGGAGNTAVSPEAGKLAQRVAARQSEGDAQAARLRQKDLGDDYQFDRDGNLAGATTQPGDLPENRVLASAAPSLPPPTEEISRGIRHGASAGDDGTPSPAPTADRSLLTPTMLGYTTVRSASWAAKRPEQSQVAVGAEPRGSAEEPMLGVMERALQHASGSTEGERGSMERSAPSSAAATEVVGPSTAGNALYPTQREAQMMVAGAIGDMRIAGGTAGPDEIVRQGKFLDCVLVNELRVDLVESPVIAMVSRDFVSLDGGTVLVPAGAKLLGTAGRVQNLQQARVYLKFDRLLFPDQRSAFFPVRQVGAADGTGAVGVPGEVDRHLLLQFGSAVMLGMLDGLAAAVQAPATGGSPAARDLVFARTSANFSAVVAGILGRYANVVPTVTVEPGAKLKVFFAEDVRMLPYMRTSDLSWVPGGVR